MEPQSPDQAIAALLNTMNRGQYLLLVLAMRQSGGELRIDPHEFMQLSTSELPVMEVDASDGPVLLRVSDTRAG